LAPEVAGMTARHRQRLSFKSTVGCRLQDAGHAEQAMMTG